MTSNHHISYLRIILKVTQWAFKLDRAREKDDGLWIKTWLIKPLNGHNILHSYEVKSLHEIMYILSSLFFSFNNSLFTTNCWLKTVPLTLKLVTVYLQNNNIYNCSQRKKKDTKASFAYWCVGGVSLSLFIFLFCPESHSDFKVTATLHMSPGRGVLSDSLGCEWSVSLRSSDVVFRLTASPTEGAGLAAVGTGFQGLLGSCWSCWAED